MSPGPLGRARKAAWILAGALALILVLAFLRSHFFSEERQVRRFIEKGRLAAQAKDLFACQEMLSPDYRDRYGFDRDSLLYTLREAFRYYQRVIIRIEEMKVFLDESSAVAQVEVTASAFGQTRAEGLRPVFEGERGKGRIKLIKDKGSWKLQEVEFYQPLTLMGQTIS